MKKAFRLLFFVTVFLSFTSCRNIFCSKFGDKCPRKEAAQTVAILSVNDIHADIDKFPRFASLADSLRAVYPDLLVFSAGDNRTGNPVNDRYEPVNYPVIALMNKVGFAVSAVGNHEWDGNVDALKKNMEDADFPFVCANVFHLDKDNLDIKPYVSIDNHGVKIDVVGLIEVRASGIPGAHPANLKDVSFKRPEDVVPDYQYLRDDCDVLILLSHCGYDVDLQLAEKYPFVDEIIGGHSHTLVKNPVCHNGVLVTQAGSHLNYATLTTMTVKDGKVVDKQAVVLDVSDRKGEDASVKAMVDDFNSKIGMNDVLSTAVSDFQNREEIGCMITDAIREVSGADFAFINTGGVRMNRHAKGPITTKDVYLMDPFNNDIVVYTMTGTQLEQFIIDSYKKNGFHPSFVSGMKYVVFFSDDGNPKSVEIVTDEGHFSETALYTVAINDYMATTVQFESIGDGQSQFMTSEEMIIRFFGQNSTVDYRGVSRVSKKQFDKS